MSAGKEEGSVTMPLEHGGDMLLTFTAMAWDKIRPPYPTREQMEKDLLAWEAELASGIVPESQKGPPVDAAEIFCVKVNGEWRRVCEGPFHFTEEERRRLEWGVLCEDENGKRVEPLESEPDAVFWSTKPKGVDWASDLKGDYALQPRSKTLKKGVPFPEDDERFRFYRKMLQEVWIPGLRELLQQGDIETARARFHLVGLAVVYMAGRAEGIDQPRWAGRRGGKTRAAALREKRALRDQAIGETVDRILRRASEGGRRISLNSAYRAALNDRELRRRIGMDTSLSLSTVRRAYQRWREKLRHEGAT